jgi:hypothetical protein
MENVGMIGITCAGFLRCDGRTEKSPYTAFPVIPLFGVFYFSKKHQHKMLSNCDGSVPSHKQQCVSSISSVSAVVMTSHYFYKSFQNIIFMPQNVLTFSQLSPGSSVMVFTSHLTLHDCLS